MRGEKEWGEKKRRDKTREVKENPCESMGEGGGEIHSVFPLTSNAQRGFVRPLYGKREIKKNFDIPLPHEVEVRKGHHPSIEIHFIIPRIILIVDLVDNSDVSRVRRRGKEGKNKIKTKRSPHAGKVFTEKHRREASGSFRRRTFTVKDTHMTQYTKTATANNAYTSGALILLYSPPISFNLETADLFIHKTPDTIGKRD